MHKKFHHEGHEEHKGKAEGLPFLTFVSFVYFVFNFKGLLPMGIAALHPSYGM